MTVEQAAKIIGLSTQVVRLGLQQERLPIGCAIRTTDSRWTYNVSEHLVKQYVGEERYNEAIKDLCLD